MDSFGPQSYSTSVKRLVPANFKMKKEANILICSIIYEINNSFIKACLANKNGNKDVTVKYVETSIRRLIPKELRTYAFASGYNEVVKFQTGLIIYKDPKIPKPPTLEPNMLRKGLQQLAETSHKNLTLSKTCLAIGCIIHKLAVKIAEQSISTIGDDPELSLENLRRTVYDILGDELFNHAEGHAASNLNWYILDTLDFSLKPIHSDGMEEKQEEIEFLSRYIQKLAKSQYLVSFTKNGSKTVDKILKEVVDRILEDTQYFIENKVLQNLAVSEYVMYEVIQNLFPPVMFKLACSYAQGRVLNYSCGMLKYEYKKPVEETEAMPVEPEEEVIEGNVLPDYRRAVKRLMQEYHCKPANGFLPLMNNILNDVGTAFAEMCSQSAQTNENILSENDVFSAVNALLPEGLRSHAFARIVHVARECPSQNRQVMDMLMLVPNHVPYDLHQEYSTLEKSPCLTDENSDAGPVDGITMDTTESDLKEISSQLPHHNVSSILSNEHSIAYKHISPSPFSQVPQERSISIEKRLGQSRTSIESPDKENEINQTSIQQSSQQYVESPQHDIVSESLGISEKNKSPQDQIPKTDIPETARKKRSSISNELQISSAPDISSRGSDSLAKFFWDKKYSSLEPPITGRSIESQFYEEKSDKSLESDTLSNLSNEREMKNENEVHVTLPDDGEKQSSAENNELSLSSFSTKSSKEQYEFEKKPQDIQPGKDNAIEIKPLLVDKKEHIQDSNQRIVPITPRESASMTQIEVPQVTSLGSEETRSTHINDEQGGSGFFNLLQQASNSFLYQLQDRFSVSKESASQKVKSELDDVKLRPASGSETVLDNNKENSLNRNQDSLHNIPREIENISSSKERQVNYRTSDEQRPKAINEENRLSSIFNLFQQASNTLLQSFQDRVVSSQESITNDKTVLDDVKMKTSREKIKKLPSDNASEESTENADAAVSKEKDSNSVNSMSVDEQLSSTADNKHFSSISAYVTETLRAIENEQLEESEGIPSTKQENEYNKLRSEDLNAETINKSKSSINLREVGMKNSNSDTLYEDEISPDDFSAKRKEVDTEIYFLDIPKIIFWNDVRPYDILM